MFNEELEGTFLRQLRDALPEEQRYTILKKVSHPEHLDQVRFYQKAWGWRSNFQIDIKDDPSQLALNEKVVVCRHELLDLLKQHFQYDVLFETEQGQLLRLK
jgi:hypothetical protein